MGLFSGIAESAGGTNQSALGIWQLIRAKKLKKDDYIPPSLQTNIAEAETLAGKNKYTTQSYDEAQVKRNSANAVSRGAEATNSSANLLNMVSGVQSKENDAMNQIGNKALQFQMVNRQNAQNLRGQRAGLELENMKRFWAQKSALKGAGIQNIMGGQDRIHQGAGTFLDSMFSMGGSGMMGGGGKGGMMGGGGGAQQSPMMPSGYDPSSYNNPSFWMQNQNTPQ